MTKSTEPKYNNIINANIRYSEFHVAKNTTSALLPIGPRIVATWVTDVVIANIIYQI